MFEYLDSIYAGFYPEFQKLAAKKSKGVSKFLPSYRTLATKVFPAAAILYGLSSFGGGTSRGASLARRAAERDAAMSEFALGERTFL